MNMNRSVALTLRAGIVLGVALIAIGEVLEMMGGGDLLLYAGILILVVTPFVGILVAEASLCIEKDRFWAGIGLVLIAITVAGMVLGV